MKLLNRLERKFGDFAIPNLTIYLIALQAFTWVLLQAHPELFLKLVLTHDGLMKGEVWRLLTILLIPPASNLLFLAIALYFFFMIGTAMEAQWGTFRYNMYILIGYVATMLAALIPGAVVSGFYLIESIFLAFAWLFPELPILLFFILPVKVKWLGLAAWIWYLYAFVTGGWATKAEVAAGTLNFLIFFHDDLWQWARTSRRKFKGNMARAQANEPKPPMHVCAECGVTDQSDRKMEFRYCPLCTGTPAYCINHIQNHKHR
jgi:hypothetical protein